jgi:photosystem II stability/assembly factor-like uncharacterized protein
MCTPVSAVRSAHLSLAPLLLLALGVLGTGCGGGESGGPDAAASRIGEGRSLDLTLTSQESGTTSLLQAVSPVSEDVVWVSGHEATYARTLDGGASWSTAVMEGEETLQFRDVEAFDASTAYLMSAGSGELSRIYRTDDGGESWTLQYTATHPDAFLDCMAFWGRDRGLAYGDAVDGVPFILHTEDGGTTWSRVPAEALPPALEGEGGFAASGTCLITGGDGHAWVATGNGERARILRTTDWGGSWDVVDVPVVGGVGAGLTTVQMDSEGRRGLALGGIIGGDTLRTLNVAITEDGGRSWVSGGSPAMLGPIYGSALVTSVAGPVAVGVGPGGMDWSPDFGRSWVSADTLTWWAVAFTPSGVGWAVGPEGRISRTAVR